MTAYTQCMDTIGRPLYHTHKLIGIHVCDCGKSAISIVHPLPTTFTTLSYAVSPTNRVGLYPEPPTTITRDEFTCSAQRAFPPSDFTCLLSSPLDDFLRYSGRQQSQWLIKIAHDICDPALKCSSLQVWDAAGEMWRNVNPTDPLTASTCLYDS